MTLEKAKTKKKITKSQLQKQKQVQNVIVNLQAPAVKKTRKRTTRPKPVQIPSKSFFKKISHFFFFQSSLKVFLLQIY